MSDLNAAARALYERCAPIAPSWDQLTETTQALWREMVLAEMYGDLA